MNFDRTTVLKILEEQVIASKANGDERWVYSDPSTYALGPDIKALTAFYNVASFDTDAQMKVKGQWRLNPNLSWTDFDETSPNTAILPWTAVAVGNARSEYFGERTNEFGPEVRFAIGVKKGTSGSMVSVQASVTLVLQHG